MAEFSERQIELIRGTVQPANDEELMWLEANDMAALPEDAPSPKSTSKPPSRPGPSTHAAHVARAMEEAAERRDRGPRKE